MKDFLQMKIGDIIPSEKKISQPMDVFVNKRKKFVAKPGLSGKKKSFQVISVCEGLLEEN